jgi:hypothetical protein
MDSPRVEFQSPQGTKVSIAKTGPDTADFENDGVIFQLEHITVSADGLTLSCDVAGQSWGVVPHLVFQIFKDDLRLTISKSWVEDGTTDYPVTDAEMSNVQAFLKDAEYSISVN